MRIVNIPPDIIDAATADIIELLPEKLSNLKHAIGLSLEPKHLNIGKILFIFQTQRK